MRYCHSAANEWDAISHCEFWDTVLANVVIGAVADLVTDLADQGYVVQSTQHPEPTSTDPSKRSWGNCRSSPLLDAAQTWAESSAGFSAQSPKEGLFALSMGGLTVMNRIKEAPGSVAGAVVFHGVADLTNGGTLVADGDVGFISTNETGGNPDAADSDVNQAYRSNGVTVPGTTGGSGGCAHTGLAAGTVPVTRTAWNALLPHHNPVDFAAGLATKPPILWFINPSDGTCLPPTQEALAEAYGPKMTVIEEPNDDGLGHFSADWYTLYRGVILDFIENEFEWD
jgi:hypothetical protein